MSDEEKLERLLALDGVTFEGGKLRVRMAKNAKGGKVPQGDETAE